MTSYWVNYRFTEKLPFTSTQEMTNVHARYSTNVTNSPLQKRERTGTSFLYWLDRKSKHFSWNVTEWKATQLSLRVFSGKLSKWELAKVAKFHTNPYNFLACLPNPYKLSILGDIWRAIILPFSSSKSFYSCLRLSNLVNLSFAYLSFSNERKATALFPSPLTFLQWAMYQVLRSFLRSGAWPFYAVGPGNY